MRYLPHTDEEIQAMLQVVGARDLDELFSPVPARCRRTGEMELPAPMTEWELNDHVRGLAAMMKVKPDFKVLIGAGSYDHHIPAIIPALTGRSEFLTSYTPYQPEMAQGTLQGIFEYQTLTARLLGMDVANASIYDGASALAEALLMGIRISKKKKRVAVSSAIHPHYRQVAATYFRSQPTAAPIFPPWTGFPIWRPWRSSRRISLASSKTLKPQPMPLIVGMRSLSPALPSRWPMDS